MKILENWKQQWHSLVLGYHFMQLVKAPYGDFTKIGRLSQEINDIYGMKLIAEFLSRYPQGKQALQERPRLGNVNLQELHQLPKNTLGYAYANQMLANGFTPPPIRAIADDPFSFIAAHLGETHDIWHIVTGCPTNKAGEIKLETFYVAQIYPSRFWIALLAKNLLKTALEDIELCEQHFDALTQGWLLGKQAEPLFGIRWNHLWETPLEQLRTQLKLNSQLSFKNDFVTIAGDIKS